MNSLVCLVSVLLIQLTSAQILSYGGRNNIASAALTNLGGAPLRNANFAQNVGNVLTGNVLPNGIPNAGPANLVLGTNGVIGGSLGNSGHGIQIVADALEVGGTLAVSGQFPIYGTVALNGNVPTDGRATVNYGCGRNAV